MVFDVYVVPKDALLVARPKGILDAPMAERIAEFVELKESETGFNRFCDLTHLDEIHPRLRRFCNWQSGAELLTRTISTSNLPSLQLTKSGSRSQVCTNDC